MSYLALKHSHAGLAWLSGLLFVTRFLLFSHRPAWRQNKWLKVLPHIIDTALLGFAIALCVKIAQTPFTDTWLLAKVIALIGYIAFGIFALRRANLVCFALSILCYGYIIGVAISHSPLSWLTITH